MNKVEEVLAKMQDEIEKVKEFAKDKTKDVINEDTKARVQKLVDKTVDVVENAKSKVIEVAKDVQDDEKFNAFLNNVTVKVQEASDFTKTKISEIVPEKEKLDDIQKQIDDSFDKLKNSDHVKTVINSAKDIKESVKEYLNKPETKAKINKAKRSTLNVAEKGMNHLRKWLETDEDEVSDAETISIEEEDNK